MDGRQPSSPRSPRSPNQPAHPPAVVPLFTNTTPFCGFLSRAFASPACYRRPCTLPFGPPGTLEPRVQRASVRDAGRSTHLDWCE